MTQLIPVVNAPLLYANNMAISNNATTPNTKIDIGAGAVRDSNNIVDIVLSSGVTLDATVNGANGLDTGSLAASTWYYIYAISSSNNAVEAATILSTSSSTPTLPFQYDSYRLIGFALTDGSTHFLKFVMRGTDSNRLFYWDASISVLSGGTATSNTGVSLATAVPAVSGISALITVEFTPATANDSVGINYYGAANTTVSTMASVYGSVAAKVNSAQLLVPCVVNSGANKIQYQNSAASGATTILVNGFTYTI